MAKFIAPKATSPIVGAGGVLTTEWQRYLNGIQELEGLVTTLQTLVASGGTLATLLTYYAGSAAGSPEGVVTAPIGSFYTRTNGGANTTLYVKESGASNTGWVAK